MHGRRLRPVSAWVLGVTFAVCVGAAVLAWGVHADRETLLGTVLPLSGGIALLVILSVGMYRGATSAAARAHERFDAAMRQMAEQLGLQYRAPVEFHDWSGASGTYRAHRVFLYIVSQTEQAMQTGLRVHLRGVSPGMLSSLRARRSRKLRVTANTGASAPTIGLPEALESPLRRLVERIDEVDVDSERIVVFASGPKDFWNYEMLTEPARLREVVDAALDVAAALERG
jgi:hypothetical protein